MKLALIVKDQILLYERLMKLEKSVSGAIVTFSGVVRPKEDGKDLLALHYEAHESMAQKQMESILSDSIDKYRLNDAIVIHRIGRVNVGETSVIVIASSEHRSEAFEGNRYIIDRIKSEVPIWKKDIFKDSEQWRSEKMESGE